MLQYVEVCCSGRKKQGRGGVLLYMYIFVAVCCSVPQSGAVCCSVLQCVVVRCSVLQCVAVCCSVLQCVAVDASNKEEVECSCMYIHLVAVCCSVLQSVAVYCSVSQCVAVCCSGRKKQGRGRVLLHVYTHISSTVRSN